MALSRAKDVVVDLVKPEVANHEVSATAAGAFYLIAFVNAVSACGGGYSTYLPLYAGLGFSVLALNQYGVQRTYKGALTLFGAAKNAMLPVAPEEPAVQKQRI